MSKEAIYKFLEEFFIKHLAIIAFSFILTVLNTYTKRKEKMTFKERILELVVKFFVGASLSILIIEMTNETNSHIIIIITTSIVLGSEIFAKWVLDSLPILLKEITNKLKNKIMNK